jgi:hypothetical protein
MSDLASKAVFLSYASQDAEAAKRICEALRAGANAVVVTVSGAAAATVITDLELRVAYQNDYEKLWSREPVKLN